MAAGRQSVVCVSAHTGEGVPELLHTVEEQLKASMEYVQVLIPFSKVCPLRFTVRCVAQACQLDEKCTSPCRDLVGCLPLLLQANAFPLSALWGAINRPDSVSAPPPAKRCFQVFGCAPMYDHWQRHALKVLWSNMVGDFWRVRSA